MKGNEEGEGDDLYSIHIKRERACCVLFAVFFICARLPYFFFFTRCKSGSIPVYHSSFSPSLLFFFVFSNTTPPVASRRSSLLLITAKKKKKNAAAEFHAFHKGQKTKRKKKNDNVNQHSSTHTHAHTHTPLRPWLLYNTP